MFAHSLTAHRRRRALTQEELAELSGLSVRTIRHLESGAGRVPRPGSVRLLADSLGLSGDDRAEFLRQAASSADLSPAPAHRPPPQLPIPAVPRQLPAATPAYVGRRKALALLDELLTNLTTPRLAVVQGTAGTGKSTLALHWAHRVASRFPDGQLYLDLQGFGPSTPLPTAEAAYQLLEGLGVSPVRIPAGVEARTALFRSVIAGRRFLLVLDNARDAGQVRPLLPGSPGSVTVVTSRADHAGLATTAAARLVSLDLFDEREAVELLSYHLGADRVAADSAAVEGIISRCAKLPLAIAIIAGRGAARTQFPLSSLIGDPHQDTVLDELTGSDVAADFRTVVSWSYRLLAEPTAQVFRLLGEVPGPDTGAAAAASLTGAQASSVRRDLATLASAHLAHEHLPERFQLHGLLRSYAGELCAGHDPAPERAEARLRLVDHYLHSAYAAAQLLSPRMARVQLPAPRPGVVPERPSDSRAAFAWFADEYPNLVEILRLARTMELSAPAWQLARATGTFLFRRGRWQDAIALQEEALAATADPVAQRHLHHGLGLTLECYFRYDEAVRHIEHALGLARRLHDDGSVADLLMDLSIVLSKRRLPSADKQAVEYAEKALDYYRRHDEPYNAAGALNGVGWYIRFGNPAQTADYCAEALRILETVPGAGPVYDPDLEGCVLDSQAAAYSLLGRHREAVDVQRAALRALERQGPAANPILRAYCIADLGAIYRAAGLTEHADASDRRAAQAYAELGVDPDSQAHAKSCYPGHDRDLPPSL